MDSPQKYQRGNVVRVAKNLGRSMSHFRSNADAVVVGSYFDQFKHGSTSAYTIQFLSDAAEVSWYEGDQLTLIDIGGEHVIERIRAEDAERKVYQTDMIWIVANWPKIRDCVPAHTITYLMARLGITEPWGKMGEGITWHSNASCTIELLNEVLSCGNVAKAEAFIEDARPRVRPLR